MAISSRVSRQSETKPGTNDDLPVRHAARRAAPAYSGIGLQPFRSAKPGLETDLIAAFIQAERFGQQSPGFLAFEVIGITFIQSVARHSVKTHHQLVGTAGFSPIVANVLCQRGNITGIVMIMLHGAQCGDIAHLAQVAQILHRTRMRCCWRHIAGRAAASECARSPVLLHPPEHGRRWKDCQCSSHIRPPAA